MPDTYSCRGTSRKFSNSCGVGTHRCGICSRGEARRQAAPLQSLQRRARGSNRAHQDQRCYETAGSEVGTARSAARAEGNGGSFRARRGEANVGCQGARGCAGGKERRRRRPRLDMVGDHSGSGNRRRRVSRVPLLCKPGGHRDPGANFAGTKPRFRKETFGGWDARRNSSAGRQYRACYAARDSTGNAGVADF